MALKIDGKKVTKTGEVQVGGLPEGIVFSPNGDYLYIGNFIDQDVSILKVDGDKLTDTGQKLKLPGHPASMRAARNSAQQASPERRAEKREAAIRADARVGELGEASRLRRSNPLRRRRPQTGARRGVDDGVRVDPVFAVEVRDVAGLAEPVDAERNDPRPRHRAEPGQRRRVAVGDGNERRARPQPRRAEVRRSRLFRCAAIPASRGTAIRAR